MIGRRFILFPYTRLVPSSFVQSSFVPSSFVPSSFYVLGAAVKESEAIHGKVSMYNQVFDKPQEQQKIMMKKSTKNMGKFGYDDQAFLAFLLVLSSLEATISTLEDDVDEMMMKTLTR